MRLQAESVTLFSKRHVLPMKWWKIAYIVYILSESCDNRAICFFNFELPETLA